MPRPKTTVRRPRGGTSLRDKDGFYTVPGDDGSMVRVRSVTTILRNGFPKAKLMQWHADVVAQEAVRLMGEIDNAAERIKAANIEKNKLAAGADPVNLPDGHRKALQALDDEMNAARIQRIEATRLLSSYEHLSRIPISFRDAGGARGSKLHNLAEHYAMGDEISEESIDPEVKVRWERTKASLNAWNFEYLMVEGCCYNLAENYAGTTDGVVRVEFTTPETLEIADALHKATGFNDAKSAKLLIDYKSSKGTYWDHALQMAGYVNCQWVYHGDGLPRMPMPKVDGAAVVLIGEAGCDLHVWPCGQREFDYFLKVKSVAEAILEDFQPVVVKGAC
jgi:hypothetical protein